MHDYAARVRRLVRHSAPLLLVVAFAVASVPAGATPRDGTFEGTTSQDRRIRFTVDQTTIKSITIVIAHSHCSLTVRARVRHLGVRVQSDDTFTVRLTDGVTIVVKGEFDTRRRASGTFRSVQAGKQCDDRITGTWDARLT